MTFAKKRKINIVKTFEEKISGSTYAHERPIFKDCCSFCNDNHKTMIVASIDRLARNVAFAVEFSESDFRGDFDINIICSQDENGYISIEELGLSMLMNIELLNKMFNNSICVKTQEELSYLNKIVNKNRIESKTKL